LTGRASFLILSLDEGNSLSIIQPLAGIGGHRCRIGSQVIIVVNASEETDFMNDTTSKLSSLLSYWLEHNKEHGAEFREWADKMAPEQKEVAGQLRQAADSMAEADGYLEKARSLLK
jgi:hypothetical protein